MSITDASRSEPGRDGGAAPPSGDARSGGDGGPTEVPTATDDRRPAGWSVGRALLVAALAAAVAFAGGYLAGRPQPPEPGSVDVGFLRDMIDHHDNAVLMAEAVVVAPDVAPAVRTFAREVVRQQRWEVGMMDAWLDDWGYDRGGPERSAMGWMGMPVPVEQMPGMQDDAALDRLRAATGREADRLFLTMMRQHHQAGVHMASHAGQHAGRAKVRELARVLAANQSGEVREYDLARTRLGLGD